MTKAKIINISELKPDTAEITDWDEAVYHELVSVELTPQQVDSIHNPNIIYEREDAVLAVHWHPEMVPLALVKARIDKMFPNASDKLFIPTQHNTIMAWDGLAGVEVDCQAKEFNRKIQLLFHFKEERLADAAILKSMLAQTYQYRQSQLFDYLDTIVNPKFEERLHEAVRVTGMGEQLVNFVRVYTQKLRDMLNANLTDLPPNKQVVGGKILVK